MKPLLSFKNDYVYYEIVRNFLYVFCFYGMLSRRMWDIKYIDKPFKIF